MAISCEPAALMADACCLLDLSWNMRAAIRVASLCALLNGDTMDCSASTLVANAKCLDACLNQAQLDAIQTNLLCQLVNAGGGGGGPTQVFAADYGGAEPGFTPTASAAIAFDTSTGNPPDMWVWDGSSWV